MAEPRGKGDSTAAIRAAFEFAPDAIFIHDSNGCFVDVNRQACESLGFTREQLLTMRVLDVEREHRLSLDRIWTEMSDDKSDVVRGIHRRKDGSTFHVEVQLSTFHVDGRKLMCAVARPVERSRGIDELESARHAERNLYREVYENANEAIGIIDHDGRYVQQNRAHAELLGYSDGELNGKTPAVHLGPTVFKEIASELAETGRYCGEHISRSKDGRELEIELSAFAVPQGEGRPPLFVGIKRHVGKLRRELKARDDRERTRLEENLRHAQKMEVIGQLAAGVAHDFNNLLTPILGFADPSFSAVDVSERLDQIRRAAERGRDLTRQLLAFARKQVLSMKVVDLRALVLNAERMMRRLISEESEIELVVSDEVAPVLADPNALEQILLNLATNARDAMPGGGRLRVEASNLLVNPGDPYEHVLGESGTYVQLQVSDSGHGMDKATLERVFEPFFTRKAPGTGTGLGLAIVYGIVRQHGGVIEADSEAGQGSTFRIILPPTETDVTTEAADRDEPRRSEGETILVAEDEAPVRALVSSVLESHGYRVLMASDGEEALELARMHEGPIDLLLTDVVMPAMNGRQLYENLSAEQPGLRVLFMSGYPRDALAKANAPEAPLLMLEKPFSASELIQNVAEVLIGVEAV